MVNYHNWNIGIYDFYFKDLATVESRTFSVDERILQKIGSEIGVNQSPTINFCKCVINFLRYGNKLRIPDPSANNSNLVPFQTAILAFFIYIAGLMGRDDKYSTNAYWTRLEGDSERKGFIEEICGEKLTIPQNGRKNLQNLFLDFAEKISKTLKIEYSFSNYFEKPYIGLPMTQAMITEKDYCLLSQKFADISNTKDITAIDFKDKMFSTILKKVHKEASFEFNKRILELYQSWDGNILEYNDAVFERKRKFINLLYAYSEMRNGKNQFYLTAEARNDFGNIPFQGKLLEKDNDSKYYRNIPIETEKVSLRETSYYAENNPKIPVLRNKREFIKLKKDGGFYIEQTAINGIKTGDRFSVISTKEFFERNYDDIERIIQDSIELMKIEGTNLYLLHNVEAFYSDNNIVAFNTANKISFEKGLKKDNTGKNIWIQGAEPIIKTKDMSSVKIDGIKNKEQTIDIRYKHNEPDISHIIELDRSGFTKSYQIVPICNMPETKDFKKNYHIITQYNIERSEHNLYNLPMVLGGYIDNITLKNDNKINTETLLLSKKISRILYLLKMHKSKERYIIPQNLKAMIQEISNYCDEKTALELNEYIEKNVYIDNYVHIYLKHIGRISHGYTTVR